MNLNGEIVRSKAGKVLSKFGDEAILMNMDTGDYIGIDSVCLSIWNLLSQPISINSLVEKLQNMYEIDRDTCKKDILLFLHVLSKEKLILSI